MAQRVLPTSFYQSTKRFSSCLVSMVYSRSRVVISLGRWFLQAWEGYHPFPVTKTLRFVCCRSLSFLALSHLFIAGHHNVALPFLCCVSLYPVLSLTLLSLTQPFLSHTGITTKPCLPFKNIYSRTNPSRLVKISFCHISTHPWCFLSPG